MSSSIPGPRQQSCAPTKHHFMCAGEIVFCGSCGHRPERVGDAQRLREGLATVLAEWCVRHDKDCASEDSLEFPCDCWQDDLRELLDPERPAL